MTMGAISPIEYALFKNGVEIANTRFTHIPLFYQAVQSEPAYIEISGNAMISISQAEITANTGDIELRIVSGAATLSGPSAITTRASLTFEKVVDI